MTIAELSERFHIPRDLLEAAGVRHANDAEVRELLGVHGYAGRDLSGVIFPCVEPRDVRVLSHRVRLDVPIVGSDGREQKYLSEQGCRYLFFPPFSADKLGDISTPVVMCEAEKSALALSALADRAGRRLLPIATGGVGGWKRRNGLELTPSGNREPVTGPSPSFDWVVWERRKIIIIFDSNVAGRRDLEQALQALASELASREAEVMIANVPRTEAANGPDDLIAVAGDEAALRLIDAAMPFVPDLPTIFLEAGEYPDAVDQAEDVLVKHSKNLQIFQRGGELVRIVDAKDADCQGRLRRQAGAVMLAPVAAVALTEIFDRNVTWQRIAKAKGGHEPRRVSCPGRIAAAYLSRFGAWRLPALTGIVSTPIMRIGGTVVCRAGYDPHTGLFLTEGWPELSGNPSREEALAALRQLEAPFAEFPFVAPEDKSVFIAAILTACQRRLLTSAPLFGFTAPAQRTGKSLLAECIAIIATGAPAPAMAVAADREEFRKAVAAVLREGHAIVNLDNIDHALGSPDLSRAITQPEYGDRILGETRLLRLPTNVLWTATGNNLMFRGDLAVRALSCRLDAKVERPEERNFKIQDLKYFVAQHRRELVMAAITILRAYAIAGQPDQGLAPWGGFDEWSATIRAPLVWLEMADPCATRQNVIEDDPDREDAAILLSIWNKLFGDEPVLIAQVIERAGSDSCLSIALLAVAASKHKPNEPDPRRLAWWCRNWRDRVVGGFVLVRAGDYGKAATWKVVRASVFGISGVSGIKNPPQDSHGGRTGKDSGQSGEFSWGENNPNDPTDPKDGSFGNSEDEVRL